METDIKRDYKMTIKTQADAVLHFIQQVNIEMLKSVSGDKETI